MPVVGGSAGGGSTGQRQFQALLQPSPQQPSPTLLVPVAATTTPPVLSANADLSGSGTLTVVGAPGGTGTAILSGFGALTTAGTPAVAGAAPLSGTGALTTTGTPAGSATAVLSGAGTVAATGAPILMSTAPLSGTGALAATGTEAGTALAAFTSTGTLAATGTGTLTAADAPSVPDAPPTYPLTGGGGLFDPPRIRRKTTAGFGGTGTLTCTGTPGRTATAAFGTTGSLTATGVADTTRRRRRHDAELLALL